MLGRRVGESLLDDTLIQCTLSTLTQCTTGFIWTEMYFLRSGIHIYSIKHDLCTRFRFIIPLYNEILIQCTLFKQTFYQKNWVNERATFKNFFIPIQQQPHWSNEMHLSIIQIKLYRGTTKLIGTGPHSVNQIFGY